MIVHTLKTDSKPFMAILEGSKTSELRNNDRGFNVGDFLILKEVDELTGNFTNREVAAKITHVQDGYGLPDGMVMLSIKKTAFKTLNISSYQVFNCLINRDISLIGYLGEGAAILNIEFSDFDATIRYFEGEME